MFVGLGLTVMLLAFRFLPLSVKLERTLWVLGAASLAWIAVMLLTSAADVGFRGARWQWLLDNIDVPLARLVEGAPPEYAQVIGEAVQAVGIGGVCGPNLPCNNGLYCCGASAPYHAVVSMLALR